MPTFRVSISRQNPPAIPGVYDYAQTVVAGDQQAATQTAYNSWAAQAQPPAPPLANCYVRIVQQ